MLRWLRGLRERDDLHLAKGAAPAAPTSTHSRSFPVSSAKLKSVTRRTSCALSATPRSIGPASALRPLSIPAGRFRQAQDDVAVACCILGGYVQPRRYPIPRLGGGRTDQRRIECRDRARRRQRPSIATRSTSRLWWPTASYGGVGPELGEEPVGLSIKAENQFYRCGRLPCAELMAAPPRKRGDQSGLCAASRARTVRFSCRPSSVRGHNERNCNGDGSNLRARFTWQPRGCANSVESCNKPKIWAGAVLLEAKKARGSPREPEPEV